LKPNRGKRSKAPSQGALGSTSAICDSDVHLHSLASHFEKVRPFLEEKITFKIPSKIEYLDFVIEYLNGRLVKFGIVQQGDSDVMIALDEAIVNAIKHGNNSDPEKHVLIVAEIRTGSAKFSIADEGPGFEHGRLPDPTDPSRLLMPTGRGLLLIRHIMDEVQYNELGNEIRMMKRGA
jgi:serine/threonine-protein kinase RsbW